MKRMKCDHVVLACKIVGSPLQGTLKGKIDSFEQNKLSVKYFNRSISVKSKSLLERRGIFNFNNDSSFIVVSERSTYFGVQEKRKCKMSKVEYFL